MIFDSTCAAVSLLTSRPDAIAADRMLPRPLSSEMTLRASLPTSDGTIWL